MKSLNVVFFFTVFSINAQEFDVEKALESATSLELKKTYEKYKGVQQPVKLKNGSVIIGDLEWMQCSIGQKWENNTCTGIAKSFYWDEAHKIIGVFQGCCPIFSFYAAA